MTTVNPIEQKAPLYYVRCAGCRKAFYSLLPIEKGPRCKQCRRLHNVRECAAGRHEYAMIYNDATTCLNCGRDKGFNE